MYLSSRSWRYSPLDRSARVRKAFDTNSTGGAFSNENLYKGDPRMKLLFVTSCLPSPPMNGGMRRVHSLISGLARSHDVSVLTFAEPQDYLEVGLRATREYCEEVVTVPNPMLRNVSRQKRLLQARSMLSSGSYERLKYHQPQLQAALDQMTTHSRYDVLVTEFAHMAYYRTPRGIPSVLDEHNIDYDILRRASQTEAGMSRRIYNYM